MKKRFVAAALATALCSMTVMPIVAQTAMKAAKAPEDKSKRPSPPATATTVLKGKKITVDYGAPSVKGRKIFGDHEPYGKVWRTGANEATSFVTAGDLMIGDARVPAGSYTLYSIPNENEWTLIINKQTGQWGTEYDESKDLVRVPLKVTPLSSPQEKMTISFEKVHAGAAELHIRWENTDASVAVMAH
jgi:Protein of unknown function (DUF2911)